MGASIDYCTPASGVKTHVLMLTSYADDEAVYAAIIAGAAGYLLKQTRGSELASAVEAVACMPGR
jgi:DNA-binding NarL/FixJ family response regulator